MSYIVSYQKITDDYTTHTLALPDVDGELQGQELCTIGDVTYVSLPDDAALPEQPAGIEPVAVELTAELRAIIKAASPSCRLIKQRAHARVAALFDPGDQKMIERLAIAGAAGMQQLTEGQQAAIAQFTQVNAGAMEWAAQQYAALGL